MIAFYDYASDWQDRFGQSIDDQDLILMEQNYQQLVKAADEQVAASSFAKERNIKTYVELGQWQTDHIPKVSYDNMTQEELLLSNQITEINDCLVDDKGEPLTNKIKIYQEIKGRINLLSKKTFFKESAYSQKEQAKLANLLFEQKGWRNILPNDLSSAISTHFANCLILIIFTNSSGFS